MQLAPRVIAGAITLPVTGQDNGIFALQRLAFVGRSERPVRRNALRETAPPVNLRHGFVDIGKLAETDRIAELAAVIRRRQHHTPRYRLPLLLRPSTPPFIDCRRQLAR